MADILAHVTPSTKVLRAIARCKLQLLLVCLLSSLYKQFQAKLSKFQAVQNRLRMCFGPSKSRSTYLSLAL